MDELQANPPRVFYFERNLATWGYQITDYAPELVAFVDENYTSLNGLGYGNVYVRNDYYAEAIQLLDMEFVLYFGDNEDVAVLQNGMTVSQMFEATETVNISSFSVMVGTYARENDCDLIVLFSDETTGEEIVSTSIDCMTIQDNEYLEIAFDSYELKEGHSYKIVFSSPDATEDNFIAIYHTADNASEEYYAAIGENEQQYNLCVKIMEDE